MWKTDEIIDALRRDARRRGRPAKYSEWARAAAGQPAARTVERVIGSWSRALLLAGLEPRSSYRPGGAVCKHGHPLIEANLYYTPAGARSCRACRRRNSREYQRRTRHAQEMYRAHKAAGLCPRCGGERVGGSVHCGACRAKMRDAGRRRQEQAARQPEELVTAG